MKPISFRRATESDAKSLVALINSAYRGESALAGWTNESHLVGGLRIDLTGVLAIIQSQEDFFLLAVEPEIIGCVHGKKEADALYFGMLTVKPELQARGIGKMLIREVERTARSMKVSRLRLSVIEVRTELISYYERYGFQKTGVTYDFPFEDDLLIPGLKLLEMMKTL